MVNVSLSGAHPLSNSGGDDASCLADLFYLLFKHYSAYSNPMATDFIQSLRTLAGLGFTACLANSGHIASYRSYLNCFLDHDEGDFRKHPASLILLSQAMANMVLLAADSFYFLKANYYSDFITILKNSLDNVITRSAKKSEEIKKIFKLLQLK